MNNPDAAASTITTALTKAVYGYVMPQDTKEIVDNSKILLLCGVTAAGKNTIIHYLVEHANYEFVVSHTTRKPRYNHGELEENGVVYWFVSEAEMLRLVQEQAFVEVKVVHGDTFYGTSLAAIQHATKAGKIPIKEPDVQGALEYVKALPHVRPVFILPPSYEVWMERLGTRGFMSEGEKTKRLASAKMELQMAIDNPDFVMLVNNEVEETAAEIIRGIDNSRETQAELRKLAQELLDYIR